MTDIPIQTQTKAEVIAAILGLPPAEVWVEEGPNITDAQGRPSIRIRRLPLGSPRVPRALSLTAAQMSQIRAALKLE